MKRFPESSRARPLALAAAMLIVPLPGGQLWYVDVQDPNCATGTGGPLDPFCTIASALLAAANGDTIFIAPGTYPERLVVGKNLALIGTGGAVVTLVDGNQLGTVLQVTAGVTASVDGLTLTDGRGAFGGGVNNAGGPLGQPTRFVVGVAFNPNGRNLNGQVA